MENKVKTEREKMMAGELYVAGDPELTQGRVDARTFIHQYNQLVEPNKANLDKRKELLTKYFGTVGQGAFIEPPFHCDYGYNIHLGENVYMNFNCIILDCNRVEIGKNVAFGPAVQIYAAHHPTNAKKRVEGPELASPVKIGDNVWVGGGSIILPGVTIGENTTIGAGSVVTKNIPANVVAVGNPCKVIKNL